METKKLGALSRTERQESKREKQRQSKEAQLRAKTAKRMGKWILALSMVSAAILVVIWLSYRGESLGQAFADQGREHIAIGVAHVPYNSNPPTSGPHYLDPAIWGIYQSELPDEALVHNLEHGGIWISYSHIDQETKHEIETLAKRHPDKLIVTPRAKDDAKIVLASWRRLLKLDRFDEDAVMAFIRTNKNRAPEPNAM